MHNPAIHISCTSQERENRAGTPSPRHSQDLRPPFPPFSEFCWFFQRFLLQSPQKYTTQASRKCLSEDNCANSQGCRHKGVLEEWGVGATTSVSTRIEHIIRESRPSPGRHHRSALIMKKDVWLRKVSGCRGAFLVKLAHKHYKVTVTTANNTGHVYWELTLYRACASTP